MALIQAETAEGFTGLPVMRQLWLMIALAASIALGGVIIMWSQQPSLGTARFQRLRKQGWVFCPRFVERFLQDFHFHRLAPELAFKLPDAVFHLPDGPVPSHTVVFCHRDAASFEHELAPTIQQIGSHAIAPGNGRNALAVIERLLNDPQLLTCGPTPTATTIGNDLNLRHKHVLKAILKPPWSGQGVRSKWGPVQF